MWTHIWCHGGICETSPQIISSPVFVLYEAPDSTSVVALSCRFDRRFHARTSTTFGVGRGCETSTFWGGKGKIDILQSNKKQMAVMPTLRGGATLDARRVQVSPGIVKGE